MAGLTGPLRWAVVIATLDPVQKHEQAGERRVLVVSYDPFHRSGDYLPDHRVACRGALSWRGALAHELGLAIPAIADGARN